MRRQRHKQISCPSAAVLSLIAACAIINPPDPLPDVRPELLALRCTEVHYNPLGTDTNNAQEHEFIEFRNTADSAINLDDVAITNGVDYAFPAGTRLEAGGYIVLASNTTFFTARYGFAPFDIYSGKLDNAGEKITLKDLKADKAFLSFTYNDKSPWPVLADGEGWSLVSDSPNPTGDPDNASYWRSSFKQHGSPGKDDPNIIVVNEVLTHTDPPQEDAIELYNPNNDPVDVGNWFLTDRKGDPMKYCIPAGTTVPANGYLVITESQFCADPALATSFKLSEYGEEVFLFSDSTGMRSKSYYHGFVFGAIENAFSFGRHVTSTGLEEFVAQKAQSLGAVNKGPLVGPIVITEIMYHPSDDLSDYLELKNIGESEVLLYDARFPDTTWKIDGVGFAFPVNATMQPGEVVLVASNVVTTDAFRLTYGVPAGIRIFSFPEALGNSGDSLSLLKPLEPYIDSTQGMVTVVPYMLRETVVFSDGGKWPLEADGDGLSLHRIDPAAYANDPANWKAADPTPGR
ncbi:MAG: lamin tail domain-containing protein [Chitinispirillaceae bacterium]|nr:lamin tail domain-containing protein [Chitinispirillaceae bacterium]